MPLILSILLLLLLSRIAGEIAERYGQPAMIGEVVAGIVLGPSILGLITMTPELKAIAELGVLLLVFHAGMDMNLDDLTEAVRGKGLWVGVVGFFTPLLLGIAVGTAFRFEGIRTVFLGLCVAITALPVSVRILMDLGKLQSRLGRRIISAAVLNDVTSLLILGIILDMQRGTGTWQEFISLLFGALLRTLFFMFSIVAIARLILYSTGHIPVSRILLIRLLSKLKGKEPVFAVTLLFVVAFAGLSEIIGLHFVIGAFFGSMLLSRRFLGKENFREVKKTASNITMALLGPLFFATIGLQFNAATLSDWKLVTAVLVVAFAGKILGGYWGGRLAGHTKPESLALGTALNGRGVMELVIASIALEQGFIDAKLFSILVLMGTVTTLVTPSLLKEAFCRAETCDESPPVAGEKLAADS